MWQRLHGMSWLRYSAIAAVAIFVVGGSGYWFLGRDKVAANDASAEKGSGVKAEVVHPKAGGIPRTTVQPGSVEPFSGASLYAKVSGRLKLLKVDIGDRVKKGELLAEIEIPELEAQADRNEAKVDDAQAKLKQVIAQKSEAEAEARAAESSVKLAAILVKAKTAFREYREKQLNRIKELVAKKAEDQRLQDEQEDYYLSAMEAENAAKEKVNAEKERETAAKVKILRVEADIKAAEADVAVAKAEWANSKVWVQYGKIAAPCDGVVTQRGYLQWDFIKAADLGGNTPPILTIISTDVLRVVVPVPDRDVPFVTPGKPAILTFDALPGATYKTQGTNAVVVSRLSNAEDYQTRLMRVEVDVRNEDGRLKQGMYGRATLILTDGAPGASHIPSAALVGRANDGSGSVRLVRDGKIVTVPVRFGMDDGVNVEILSGIGPQDSVVMSTNVPAADGTSVTMSNASDTPKVK